MSARIVSVVGVAAMYATATAWAQTASTRVGQDFPTKPVRFVIPFAAGTAFDTVGRVLTDPLAKLWGQQVIADNRVGASGAIGAAFVAKSTPDGYTLFNCNLATNAIAVTLLEKVQYEHRDFSPITRVGMTANVITVHPSTPFKSIKDVVAHAKANPGKISYSAGLVGTTPHMAMELLKLRMKFDIVHIPYKNAGQATSDVVAGQLPINITNTPIVVPHLQNRRLRALAVTSAHRQAMIPDVPTMQESGVSDFDVNAWYGVCAPAGVPVALLDRIHADLQSVLRMPETQQRLADLGMPLAPLSREEFDKFMRIEIARWARVIKEAGIPKQH